MKFFKKDKSEECERVIKVFALFPITISDGETKETRWLEIVRIRQGLYSDPLLGISRHWENEEFV